MNAELSRRLAQAFNTPYFSFLVSVEPDIKEQVTKAAIAADTIDKLPDDVKQLLEKADMSLSTANILFPKADPGFLTIIQLEQLGVKIENDYQQK